MMSGVSVVLEQVKARTPTGMDLEESTSYSRDCRLVWRYSMVPCNHTVAMLAGCGSTSTLTSAGRPEVKAHVSAGLMSSILSTYSQ